MVDKILTVDDLKKIYKDSAIGVALVGRDGEWLAVNDKLCELLQYTEPELTAKKFQDVTHPEDVDLDVYLSNEVAIGKRQGYSMVKRYITKTGKIITITLTVTAVRNKDTGQFLYFISQIIPLVNGPTGIHYKKDENGMMHTYREPSKVSKFIEKNWKWLLLVLAASNQAIGQLITKLLELFK